MSLQALWVRKGTKVDLLLGIPILLQAKKERPRRGLSGLLAVPLSFTQELDLVGINERHVLLAAGLLVIPRFGPLPAFEEDPAAFVEVFGHDLGAFAKRLDVEPLGVFLRLAGTVLPTFVAGDGEGGDGCATRGVLHFRVSAQISDQQSLLHGGCLL